jgi:hypothetical protein
MVWCSLLEKYEEKNKKAWANGRYCVIGAITHLVLFEARFDGEYIIYYEDSSTVAQYFQLFFLIFIISSKTYPIP